MSWTGPTDNIAQNATWSSNLTATSLPWLKNATAMAYGWADQPNPAKRNYAASTSSKVLKYSVGNFMNPEFLDQVDNYDLDFDTRLFWWPATAKAGDAASWTLDAANVKHTVAASFSTAVNNVLKAASVTGATHLASTAIAVCSVLALF